MPESDIALKDMSDTAEAWRIKFGGNPRREGDLLLERSPVRYQGRRRRVLEWAGSAILLLVVTMCVAGALYWRERQQRLDGRLAAALHTFDLRRAKSLVREGADVRVRGRVGLTALMVAAHKGDVPFVRELLARGAEANVTNERGQGPLYDATLGNEREIIRLLCRCRRGRERR